MTLAPSSNLWAAILLAASASFIAYAQSKLPADLDLQSRARLPYLKKSDMDAKGQKIFDTLPGAGKDDILRGPLEYRRITNSLYTREMRCCNSSSAPVSVYRTTQKVSPDEACMSPGSIIFEHETGDRARRKS